MVRLYGDFIPLHTQTPPLHSPLGYEQLFKQIRPEQSLPVYGGLHIHRLTGYSTLHQPLPLQLLGQSRTEQSSVRKGGAH